MTTKVKPQNIYAQYAINYNCSIAQAIGDRDYPWDIERCLTEFQSAANRLPTFAEITIMHPETNEYINDYMREIEE